MPLRYPDSASHRVSFSHGGPGAGDWGEWSWWHGPGQDSLSHFYFLFDRIVCPLATSSLPPSLSWNMFFSQYIVGEPRTVIPPIEIMKVCCFFQSKYLSQTSNGSGRGRGLWQKIQCFLKVGSVPPLKGASTSTIPTKQTAANVIERKVNRKVLKGDSLPSNYARHSCKAGKEGDVWQLIRRRRTKHPVMATALTSQRSFQSFCAVKILTIQLNRFFSIVSLCFDVPLFHSSIPAPQYPSRTTYVGLCSSISSLVLLVCVHQYQA